MTLRLFIKYHIDPDVYFDIQGLPDPFEVRIPIGITNNETIGLYFRAELVTPPAGYSNYVKDLGFVGAGSSAYKVFTFNRAQPTLVDGELDEALTLKISAYTDAAYTDLYGEATFDFTIHYFDHTDPAWTELYHDNFDDGTLQGWAYLSGAIDPAIGAEGRPTVSGVHYITAPYGLDNGFTAGYYNYKDYTVGVYVKARIIVHFYLRSGAYIAFELGDKLIKPGLVPVVVGRWNRLCADMPVDATTRLAWQCDTDRYSWIDEIIVVAK